MKPLSVLCVAFAFGAGLSPAVAAPDSDSATDNPYAHFDPDGVPLVVTQPNIRRRNGPTQQDMEAARTRVEQAVIDSNWLLRGYEEQLRLRNQPTPSEPGTDLYMRLSTNKDLAKLAGLPQIDPGIVPDRSEPRTGATANANSAASLRTASNSYSGYTFKPLITPLSSPGLGSTTSSTSSLASQIPSFLGGDTQAAPTPAPRASRVSPEASELDTPGAMADRDNPLSEPAANDLTLDLLPGESAAEARARAVNNQDPQLPVLLNSNQLHAEQTAALKGPSGKNVKPGQKVAAQPPVAKPVEPVPAEEPMGVGQGAAINPVHAPIASPFSILNR